MTQKYYKCTGKGGRTQNNFVYHIGYNEEPKANVKTKDSCGIGLHLAKTLTFAERFISEDEKEYYTARPGVILGEDINKVRCKGVWIDKKLTPKHVEKIKQAELRIVEKIKQAESRIKEKQRLKAEKERLRIALDKQLDDIIRSVNNNPLCGVDWLKKHALAYTQADIDALSISVSSNGHTVTLKNNHKLKRKEIKQVMTTV